MAVLPAALALVLLVGREASLRPVRAPAAVAVAMAAAGAADKEMPWVSRDGWILARWGALWLPLRLALRQQVVLLIRRDTRAAQACQPAAAAAELACQDCMEAPL
jgi:hypothetical protein